MSLRTGLPKFNKKNEEDSFYQEGSIKISGYWVKLPRMGWVKSHEELHIVNPQNVTISKRAGGWYISFKIDGKPQTTPKVRELQTIKSSKRSFVVTDQRSRPVNVRINAQAPGAQCAGPYTSFQLNSWMI
jgi:hypothetical protein